MVTSVGHVLVGSGIRTWSSLGMVSSRPHTVRTSQP